MRIREDTDFEERKFGKHIQKRQLDIPEYAPSFVDYKALKKLIKKLSGTPVLRTRDSNERIVDSSGTSDSRQPNNACFLFRLDRELEKVNKFYLQKEAELKLRLHELLDKKKAIQAQSLPAIRLSSSYYSLEEGLRQYSSDLNKLQQFIDINATAFSKILKKWDKISKSKTKELFLSRAVEVQPCFNREVITHLSDQALTNLLDLGAWAEGDKTQYSVASISDNVPDQPFGQDDIDLESRIIRAAASGYEDQIREWLSRLSDTAATRAYVTRVLLGVADEAPNVILDALIDSGLTDLRHQHDINGRNCLHSAAISGNILLLRKGIAGGSDIVGKDIYGRMALHYGCIDGNVDIIECLLSSNPEMVDIKDQDGFTPLMHAIINSRLACARKLFEYGAQVDPNEDSNGLPNRVPLNLACQCSTSAVVEMILQRNPKIVADTDGLFPQHLVAQSGKYPSLITTLKNYGVDLDQQDRFYQWTPLIHAAKEGHVKILRALLAFGVTVDSLDEKGFSALYYATLESHLDCMTALAPKRTIEQPIMELPGSSNVSGTFKKHSVPFDTAAEGIPPISLPPPIIPLRRYGHNFLDNKTFVVITFDGESSNPIELYDNSKYPAARLMITSKSSDLVPRSLLLPIQYELKTISFQIENLETFSLEFDIYPLSGTKLIARTVASSIIFTSCFDDCGKWHLEFLDPRLKAVGRITFSFRVLKPFSSTPIEITNLGTYWKVTSQLDLSQNPLVTSSSLSGEYIRLYLQMTADGEIVVGQRTELSCLGLSVPLRALTYTQLRHILFQNNHIAKHIAGEDLQVDLSKLNDQLKNSYLTLRHVLKLLPLTTHLELHILQLGAYTANGPSLGSNLNVNYFADMVLSVVFEHSMEFKASSGDNSRSILFTSNDETICLALNWKQPNFPVLLCNKLKFKLQATESGNTFCASGQNALSLKETIRTAQENNLMGIVCHAELLHLVPALISTIKSAGLVLVSDLSALEEGSSVDHGKYSYPKQGVPDGVDGYVRKDGILKFHEPVPV